jgi:membrane-associated phospholipid phosphatase
MSKRKLLVRGSWMLLIPLLSPVYDYLNGNHGAVYTMVTDLDRVTPFIPQFILPYIIWYGFIFAILIWLMIKDGKLYAITLGSIVVGLLASYGVYAVFQTTVPRPAVPGQDIFSHLIRLVYNNDKPYNAFPSIHVLTSYIIFLVSYETKVYSKELALGSQALSILIIFSTVFLKQHVLLDVAGGIVFGWAAYKLLSYAYDTLVVREVRTWQEKSSLLSMTNMKSQS